MSGVTVTGPIKQKFDNDPYGTHESKRGTGGAQTGYSSINDVYLIPVDRREPLMIVSIISYGGSPALFWLNTTSYDPLILADNDNWELLPIGQVLGGGIQYKGGFSAITGQTDQAIAILDPPTLSPPGSLNGHFYICNAAGTIDFGQGNQTFNLLDYAIYDGVRWRQFPGSSLASWNTLADRPQILVDIGDGTFVPANQTDVTSIDARVTVLENTPITKYVRYVANQNGSDTADGSRSTPYKTINAALVELRTLTGDGIVLKIVILEAHTESTFVIGSEFYDSTYLEIEAETSADYITLSDWTFTDCGTVTFRKIEPNGVTVNQTTNSVNLTFDGYTENGIAFKSTDSFNISSPSEFTIILNGVLLQIDISINGIVELHNAAQLRKRSTIATPITIYQIDAYSGATIYNWTVADITINTLYDRGATYITTNTGLITISSGYMRGHKLSQVNDATIVIDPSVDQYGLESSVMRFRAGASGMSSQEVEAAIIEAYNSGGGHIIEDEGTPLTQRNTLNFVGDGVAVTDVGGKTQVGITLPPGGGETNTASNVGTAGVGLFKQKNVVDLEFKKLNAASNKLTIADDVANDEVDIDVDESNFTGIPNSALATNPLDRTNHTGTQVATTISDFDTEVSNNASVVANTAKFSATLQAKTWNVDGTNGLDTNDGSEQRPFQTIGKAISVVSAGDTIFVVSGTYNESFTIPAEVSLIAFQGGMFSGGVIVNGTITMGESIVKNIAVTNITVSGSLGTAVIEECNVSGTILAIGVNIRNTWSNAITTTGFGVVITGGWAVTLTVNHAYIILENSYEQASSVIVNSGGSILIVGSSLVTLTQNTGGTVNMLASIATTINGTDPNPTYLIDTSIVPETTDKNYVTDAEKTVVGNTSGTNTGDEPDATTTAKGIAELATDGENAADVVVQGNDGRLSNARFPTVHNFAGSEHLASTLVQVNSKVSDATLIDTNDSRLSDDRNPTAHGSTHVNGTDDVPDVVGDSGAGGTKGLVPAPAAGDAAAGKYLKADGLWTAPSGSGDMLAATYDPNTVASDAFDMDNMVEGTAKILTAAERTTISNQSGTNTGDEVLRGTHVASTTVSFEKYNVYGTKTAARTGNILFSFTSDVFGTTCTMRHNDSTAPTLPAEAVVKSGKYIINTDNIIMFQLVDDTTSSEVVHVYYGSNGKDNLTATVDPAVGNDETQGYDTNSYWLNTSTPELFYCADPSTGAADWLSLSGAAGATNLGYTASPTNGIVTSDTGTDATLPLATGINAGLLAPADFTNIASNTTHRTSTGVDHTYIDQDVTSGSTPTLTGTNITGIPDGGLSSGATVVSAGAGDSGKLVKLDTAGHVDASAINDGDINHANIAGIGTNTHDQIDTHIGDSTNPHSTDLGNLGTGTIAELNALITDLIATYGGIRDFGVGTAAQRPAFGTANRFWWATDTLVLSRDTGTAWENHTTGNGATQLTELSDVGTAASTANFVLATPDGTTGDYSGRALVADDIPSLTLSKITDSGALAALNTVGNTQIDDDSVTYAKMQNVVNDDTLLGRISGPNGIVEELTKGQVLTLLNVEDGADITDTANVTSAGALMDSEVDADLKTFVLPANTTISTFGASLVDDTDAAAARTTLDVEQSGTKEKSWFVENPTATDDLGGWVTDKAITITGVRTWVRGTGTPTVTFNIIHGTDPTSTTTTKLWSADQVANTTTTIQTHSTSYNDSTCAAGEAIRLVNSAVGGTTQTGFNVTIFYTID